ncbi:uncharacterized protein LOC118737322 [Rhagoletis pomonella]|uniref:uncharacterized protein LOC118737322 n=1 Tax=Rhagoletis pomonella TaxID=28610 RepID=UPI00177D8247|nr:uncharacterized protein LOC118737322 [Rhagoletis pomonella]
MADEYKSCDICKDKTNCSNFDLLWFGDWQQSRDVVVHYFCLLLSTNLPQRGKDCSGINGFLLRDIRKEINAATKRMCCYCGRTSASIQCFKCRDYFHILCGRKNRCLFTFHSDFRSYCDDCIPKTDLRPAKLKSRPSSFERCSICREQMGLYDEVLFIFGKCCNKGYAHNMCVQKYALAAGYYLRCLWCRSEEFRQTVRLQGVFVPDRDARWEVQKGTYTDLHRGHNTCNMEPCLCPKGRDYNGGKWSLILCSLCGSVGAHNPKCLLGKENAKEPVPVFKCATCARTESTIAENRQKTFAAPEKVGEVIDKSIFMTKIYNDQNEKDAINFLPSFSDDDETQSSDSFVTVIPQKNSELKSSISNCPAPTINERNEFISSKSNNDISLEVSINTEVTGQKLVETHILVIDCSDDERIDEVKEKTSSHKKTDTQVLEIEDEESSNKSTEKPTEPPLIGSQVVEINCSDQYVKGEVRGMRIPLRPIQAVTEINFPDDTQMKSKEKSATPQLVASQVMEINCFDEETRNIVPKPPMLQPIIFVDDEETQIFEKSSTNTPETKVVKKASLTQQSSSCYFQQDETQLFDICTLDKRNTDIIKEHLSTHNEELGSVDKTPATISTQSVDLTSEIVYMQESNPPVDTIQSPIVTSSQSEENDQWITFDVYKYDDEKGKCIGSATMRINLCDKRFAGMTMEQIENNSSSILSVGDIIAHSEDIGVFAEIDAIIAGYTK